MKFFYSVILFILCAVQTHAQSSNISGKVHLEDGTPVGNVTVSVVGTEIGSISDAKGMYMLKNVPYGWHEINVSSIEIASQKISLLVKKEKELLDVHISPKGDVTLDEVKVQRNTAKRALETSGFAVAVIETKEASLRNITTNELLDRAVGVRVRQNGGEGAAIEYNLNGMSGNAIGIFLDGIEISTYGSSFNLNNIPPVMIERIEVYKGVLPAHLSGNYIGGAINVIMKKDASANSISAAVSYGSFNTYRADAGLLYRNQKNGFTARATGFYSHSDNNYEMWGRFAKYTLPSGRTRPNYRVMRANDKFETVGGRFEAGFTDVKWADQFFIGYNVSDSYKQIPHGITMAKPYFGRFNEYQAHVLSLNYSKANLWVDGLSLNVKAVQSWRNTYLQDTVSQRYNWDGIVWMMPANEEGISKPFPHVPGQGQQGDAVMEDINRSISNIRSNLSYTIIPNHRITLDHNFVKTTRDDQDLLDPERSKWITQNNLTTNIFALNYEAAWLQGKLLTNVFGKHMIYQTDQKVPQSASNGAIEYKTNRSLRDNQAYGGTLSYQAIKDGFVILSAEKAFIVPTERHIFGEPENNLLPNENILAEMSINYNIGARYSILANQKHRISLYGNAFWRNGYDKIMLQTRVDPVLEGRENEVEAIEVTQFVNLPKTQSRGFEGEVTYVYDNKLNMMVNFSKFNSLFKLELDDNGKPHSFYNMQIPNEPFYTINGNVQYRFDNVIQKSSVLNAYYNMGYVAPFSTIWYSNPSFTTPTQFTHDMGLSYRFPSQRLVASVDAKNMLNAEIYDNFGVQKPGRAFYIKLNYTINNFNK